MGFIQPRNLIDSLSLKSMMLSQRMNNIQYKAALFLEIALEDSDDDDYLNYVLYSSSSDENEETVKNLQCALTLSKHREKMNRRPRIQDFIERVIPQYTAQKFKTHFRYVVFILIANVILLL